MKKSLIITLSIVLALAIAAAAVYFFVLAPSSDYIDRTEAKKAALDTLGVNAADVLHLKTDLEKDDGYTYYEVSFTYDKQEYDYYVDAYTGEVLSFEKESVFD